MIEIIKNKKSWEYLCDFKTRPQSIGSIRPLLLTNKVTKGAEKAHMEVLSLSNLVQITSYFEDDLLTQMVENGLYPLGESLSQCSYDLKQHRKHNFLYH